MKIRRRIVSTSRAPVATAPYSQAVLVDGILHISGQLGIDPHNFNIVAGGVVAQTRQAFRNIQEILNHAKADFKGATPSASFQDVVHVRVLLANIADFAAVNVEYAKYFKTNMPARAAFQVSALPKGGLIEIEVVAAIGVVDSGSIYACAPYEPSE